MVHGGASSTSVAGRWDIAKSLAATFFLRGWAVHEDMGIARYSFSPYESPRSPSAGERTSLSTPSLVVQRSLDKLPLLPLSTHSLLEFEWDRRMGLRMSQAT